MFDHFSKEKPDFLMKKDKSRKGCIDKDAVKIVNEINSKKDFYTTSSCSGRIVLLEMKSKRKDECSWILTKHNKVKLNEIKNSLKKYIKNSPITKINNKIKNNQKNQIWFKQQPLILHVACRNLDAAKRLLDAARKVFKHSGIISINEKKIVVEIIGNERIETIIADKNFAADENYIKNLVKYANDNFEENKKKSVRFLKILKSL
ncbi:hypothetical protein J4234_05405 [Candidatus Woesearchaeota archaeon]|nr:hypothetical protein [Candidatus Woesearchaeota archaeon]